MSWLGVWSRAVVGPAYRRAMAVWAGAAIVAAVLFGPTGLPPHTVTLMMRQSIGAALVIGGTWLLLFVPIARVIVHADAARFLRSLPHSSITLAAVRVAALVGLQLPWLALWTAGEIVMRPQVEIDAGVGGPLVALFAIALSTLLAVIISAWRPPAFRRRNPRWTSSTRAFRAVYVAALLRRAGDALVRGAGLALLAGLAAGLFVHNNALVGEQAAKMAGIISVLALVPAHLGLLSPLLDAHRKSAWLAESAGVSSGTRAASLAATLVGAHLVAALLAIVGVALVLAGSSGATDVVGASHGAVNVGGASGGVGSHIVASVGVASSSLEALSVVPSAAVGSSIGGASSSGIASSTAALRDYAANVATLGAIAGTLVACAIASALGATAVVIRATTARMAATQLVSNSFLVAVGIAVMLATMSTPVGPLAALIATGAFVVVQSERSVDASTINEVRA